MRVKIEFPVHVKNEKETKIGILTLNQKNNVTTNTVSQNVLGYLKSMYIITNKQKRMKQPRHSFLRLVTQITVRN